MAEVIYSPSLLRGQRRLSLEEFPNNFVVEFESAGRHVVVHGPYNNVLGVSFYRLLS